MILLDFYVPIDGSIWKGQERPLRTSNLAFTSVWMSVRFYFYAKEFSWWFSPNVLWSPSWNNYYIRHYILKTCGWHLSNRVISQSGEVWAHKTRSIRHFLLNSMYRARRFSGHIYVDKGVSIVPIFLWLSDWNLEQIIIFPVIYAVSYIYILFRFCTFQKFFFVKCCQEC